MPKDRDASPSGKEEEQFDGDSVEEETSVDEEPEGISSSKKRRTRKSLESLKSRPSYLLQIASPVKLAMVRGLDTSIASIVPTESKASKPGNLMSSPVDLKALMSFDRNSPQFPSDGSRGRKPESFFGFVRPVTVLTDPDFDRKAPDIGQVLADKRGNAVEALKPVFLRYISQVAVDLDRSYSNQLLPVQSTEQETSSEPSPPASSGGGEGEPPDFLELVFGSGARSMRGKGSHIVLFLDNFGSSYLNFLEEICSRIYRELKGGLSKWRVITMDQQWNQYLQRQLDQNERMVSINLDSMNKGLETGIQLRNRFEEFCKQDLGFIIIRTEKQDTYEHYKEELERMRNDSNESFSPIFLKAMPLPEFVANFIWANSLEGTSGGQFDRIFNEAKREYKKRMEYIKHEENGNFKTSTERWSSEEQEHYDMKVFVVRFLVNKLRRQKVQLNSPEEIKSKIKTEEEENGVVPDVEDVDDSQYYEIETLFGEKYETDKKIDETIEKLLKVKVGQPSINIVIDNLTFLMHLQDLKRIRKAFPGVNLLTLSFENGGTLIRFSDVPDWIYELQKIQQRQSPDDHS